MYTPIYIMLVFVFLGMATLAMGTPVSLEQDAKEYAESNPGNPHYVNDFVLKGNTVRRVHPNRNGNVKVIIQGTVNGTITDDLTLDLSSSQAYNHNFNDGQFRILLNFVETDELFFTDKLMDRPGRRSLILNRYRAPNANGVETYYYSRGDKLPGEDNYGNHFKVDTVNGRFITENGAYTLGLNFKR